jgi:hypothetical protein
VAKLALRCEFNDFAFFFFAPEIQRFNQVYFVRRRARIDNASPAVRQRFLYFDQKRENNWSEHCRLRKMAVNPCLVATSIREDDVTTCQTMMVLRGLEPNSLVAGSFYENLGIPGVPEEISFMGYAALFGSVRCFRFFLLNGGTVDQEMGHLAIVGNNLEIVRLCEEYGCSFSDPTSLYLSIQFHLFAIFVWLFETKLGGIRIRTEDVVTASINSGNFEVLVYFLVNGKDWNGVCKQMTGFICQAHRMHSYSTISFLTGIAHMMEGPGDIETSLLM